MQPVRRSQASESEAPDDSERVGEHIRRLRKARGMTLTVLSEATGISVGYLSQIERNISSPTVKTLFEISHALGVTIGWFFDRMGGEKSDEKYIVRQGNRQQIRFESGITDYRLTTDAVEQLEVLWSTFEPGTESGDDPYQHEGEECGLVVKGQFELTIDGTVYLLEEGDSFSFPSTMPHSYKNIGREEAVVMWCITPPTY
ncbi:MAG: cupin domain-containing protein [Pseudomonadota bacterium]